MAGGGERAVRSTARAVVRGTGIKFRFSGGNENSGNAFFSSSQPNDQGSGGAEYAGFEFFPPVPDGVAAVPKLGPLDPSPDERPGSKYEGQ